MFTEVIDDFTDLKTKILLKITKDDNSEPRFQWFENFPKCRISCASYFGGLRDSDVRNSEKFWAPSAPNFLHFLTKLSNNSSGNSLVSNIRNICFLMPQLSFQAVNVSSVCKHAFVGFTRLLFWNLKTENDQKIRISLRITVTDDFTDLRFEAFLGPMISVNNDKSDSNFSAPSAQIHDFSEQWFQWTLSVFTFTGCSDS